MTAIVLSLFFATMPEPKPLPGAVPAETFSRPNVKTGMLSGWCNRPNRQTKYWRGTGGLLFCDDPGCLWCVDEVYGTRQWEDAKPIRK